MPALAVGDSVDLRFDWPVGASALVTLESTRSRGPVGRVSKHTVSGTYRLVVSEEGDGRRIEFKDGRLISSLGSLAGTEKKMHELMVEAMANPAGFEITSAGRFIRLADVSNLQQNIRDMLDSFASELTPDARIQFSQMFAQMTDEEVLQNGAVEQWHRDVGFWSGAGLDVGDWYEMDYTNRVSILGNRPLAMKKNFSVVERVPCSDGDGAADCVRIEMTSVAGTDELEQAFAEFIQKIAEQTKTDPEIEKLSFEQSTVVITEPATLRPHKIETHNSSTILMSVAGRKQNTIKSERTRRAFFWSVP
jgi:hypothetical protein